MIPQETVGRIIDAARIEDVVGEFVSLKRRGANFVACCPFHNEKTPSFYVSPAKGIFKCFGCGKAGTAVSFVMEHESLSYVDALKYLAKKYGIEVVEKEESAEEIAKRQKSESLMLVSEYAAKFFQDSLKTDEGRNIGYAYFKSRGLEDATIEKFGLGWAPTSRHALSDTAKKAGWKDEFLVDTGLSVRRDDGSLSDRYYDRVIFPIYSVSGRPIAFGGRTLRTDKVLAKYINSPETEIYVKSRSLYGISHAKNEIVRQKKCILVEGYLDVISMHQLGITNVVASSGTSLTVEQIRLIRRFTENVTIIYDGDSAGIHAALRGIGLVLKEGLNVKVVLLPDGDDPDSYSRKHTLEEVQNYISAHEQDFIEFKSDILLAEAGSDPIKRADLINDIADTVALIPDAVKRSVYIDVCSKKFDVDSKILLERIAKTRLDMMEKERKEQELRRRREEAGLSPDGPDAAGASGRLTQPIRQQDSGGFQTVQSGSGTLTSVSAVTAPGGLQLEDIALATSEKELLDFIIDSGTDELAFDRDSDFYVEGGESQTVAEFIDSTLAEDEVKFSNSIYRKVYDAYFELYDQGLSQEQIRGRLLNSEDREVALVTADLVEDKYLLTVENYRNSMTSKATILVVNVPKALLVYQKKRIEKLQAEYDKKLEAAGDDAEAQLELMVEIGKLNKLRTEITNRLGRV